MKTCIALLAFLTCFSGWAETPPLNVELQWSLCPADFASAAHRLEIDAAAVKYRDVYYFDTQEGDYSRDGVLFRMRAHAKKKLLTIKIRNLNPDLVPDRFWKKDFKCETDKYRERVILACSLNRELKNKEFNDLISGNKSLRSMLNDSQKEFLALARAREQNLDHVQLFGPAAQKVVPLRRDGLSEDMSLEYTSVGTYTGLQYSIRVPADAAAAVEKSATADLRARGLHPCPVEPPSLLEYLLAEGR